MLLRRYLFTQQKGNAIDLHFPQLMIFLIIQQKRKIKKINNFVKSIKFKKKKQVKRVANTTPDLNWKLNYVSFHLFYFFNFILFTVTSAIECYKCNSEYDPRCGDPMNAYSLGTVNCSMVPPLEHLPEMQSTICRKTVQKSK